MVNGVDPSLLKKAAKQAAITASENSFQAIAQEWYVKHSVRWVPSHHLKIIRRLERDVFPWIGSRPIAQIMAPEFLTVLRRVENRGALDTAHRIYQTCGQVFRYAIATGRAERNPTSDLRGALPPVQGNSFAVIIEPHKLEQLLRTMDGYEGYFVTKCALRLAPLLFVRPGELRQAEWS